MITKKQFEALGKWEPKLTMVRRTGYVRITRTELNEFLKVYEDLYGETLTTSQRNCSHCITKAVRRVADSYTDYLMEEANRKRKKREKDAEPEQPADA